MEHVTHNIFRWVGRIESTPEERARAEAETQYIIRMLRAQLIAANSPIAPTKPYP